ncbi:MAG: outer membrane beta-barrel protein [Xanthobacteraceae bacterium]
MRRFVLAAFVAVTAQAASAADLPILRGSYLEPQPAPRAIWEGFYVGGQASYGVTDADFTNATKDLTAKMLYGTTMENEFKVSEWPLMGNASNHGRAYGGFAGYNWQWDDAVVGIEANYLFGRTGTSDRGSMSRSMVASDGYTYGITSTSTGRMEINHMGSLRVRGGYAWNSFLMPYGFLGIGIGQGTFEKTSNVSGVAVNTQAQPGFTNIPFDISATEVKNNRLLFGYSAGVGLDFLLIGGLFLRAEYEYTQFAAPVDTVVNTVRVGAGYKF